MHIWALWVIVWNSKRAFWRAPAFKITTEIPREAAAQRDHKERNFWQKKQKREIFGSHPSGLHLLALTFFWVWTPPPLGLLAAAFAAFAAVFSCLCCCCCCFCCSLLLLLLLLLWVCFSFWCYLCCCSCTLLLRVRLLLFVLFVLLFVLLLFLLFAAAFPVVCCCLFLVCDASAAVVAAACAALLLFFLFAAVFLVCAVFAAAFAAVFLVCCCFSCLLLFLLLFVLLLLPLLWFAVAAAFVKNPPLPILTFQNVKNHFTIDLTLQPLKKVKNKLLVSQKKPFVYPKKSVPKKALWSFVSQKRRLYPKIVHPPSRWRPLAKLSWSLP